MRNSSYCLSEKAVSIWMRISERLAESEWSGSREAPPAASASRAKSRNTPQLRRRASR